MPKSLSTFLDECRREIPNEVVHIGKTIDPAHYDATAIIKHLGAEKKFPIAIFDKPLNLHGQVSDFPLVLNCEISQRKTQIALGMPRGLTRSEMAEACLAREAKPIPPIVIDTKDAPVKRNIKRGADVDLFQLPFMRHYEMDGGPYSTLSTITKDRKSGIYNCSYHRMEIKSPNRTALYASPRHLWRMYRDYEEQNMECPVATVMGHHPAYHIGACYTGPFEVSEFDIIGGYLQEPLRLTPSATWGD
ncbi:MAG: UbiD family decarboxylase domain-containing protein, partial [Candidatus Binatia bacterium]